MPVLTRGGVLLDGDGRMRVGWRLAAFVAAYLLLERVIGLGFSFARRSLAEPGATAGYDLGMAATILLGVLAFAAVWIFRRCLDGRSLASLGFAWDRRARLDIALGLAFGAGLVLGSVLLTAALGYGSWRLASPGEGGWPLHGGRLLLAMLGFLAGALVEESVFRGYITGNLAESGRPYCGVLVSSLLFAAGHLGNPGAWESPLPFLNMFLTGLTLALLYLRLRSLWAPLAIHFAWNFALLFSGGAVSGLAGPQLLEPVLSGPASVTGSEYGVEGGLMTTAFHALAALVLFLWKGRERANESAPAQQAGATGG